jgi:tripartite-type tricarboxylate transporter receptor subunit TctC
MVKVTSAATFAALMLAAAATTGGSASADVSLHGKTVNLYVGGSVGGGVDAYARTLGPYLSKYLPGNPNVVPSNMPGGGGVGAVQYVYNVGVKNGTAVGAANPSSITEPLLGTVNVHYDLKKFRWIGSLYQGNNVCVVWHETGIKTLKDAQTHEVTLAAVSVGSASAQFPRLLNTLIHTKFKPVLGYPAGSTALAIERREVDGTCGSLGTFRTSWPDLLRDKKLVLLVQASSQADSEYPDVPRAVDLVKGDDERAILEFFGLPYELQNAYMLPPGTPDDILAAYRKAFDLALQDPDFRADAKKRNQEIEPHNGAEVTALIEKVLATPKNIVERAVAAIGKAPSR